MKNDCDKQVTFKSNVLVVIICPLHTINDSQYHPFRKIICMAKTLMIQRKWFLSVTVMHFNVHILLTYVGSVQKWSFRLLQMLWLARSMTGKSHRNCRKCPTYRITCENDNAASPLILKLPSYHNIGSCTMHTLYCK